MSVQTPSYAYVAEASHHGPRTAENIKRALPCRFPQLLSIPVLRLEIMASTSLRFVALLVAISACLAAPAPSPSWRRDFVSGNVTALSPAQITSFRPYTHFASTAYCQPNTTLKWDCGPNCDANPTFQPVASGGDGVLTQFCECRCSVRGSAACRAGLRRGSRRRRLVSAVYPAPLFPAGCPLTRFPKRVRRIRARAR